MIVGSRAQRVSENFNFRESLKLSISLVIRIPDAEITSVYLKVISDCESKCRRALKSSDDPDISVYRRCEIRANRAAMFAPERTRPEQYKKLTESAQLA